MGTDESDEEEMADARAEAGIVADKVFEDVQQALWGIIGDMLESGATPSRRELSELFREVHHERRRYLVEQIEALAPSRSIGRSDSIELWLGSSPQRARAQGDTMQSAVG